MRVIEETLHPKGGALFLRSRDGTGFVRVSDMGDLPVPARIDEDSPLTVYFKDHPQPFVRDITDDLARPRSTRNQEERESAA